MVQGIARLAPLLLLILAIPARAEQPWEPISPEELKMTSEPKAPKAPAIYLMRKHTQAAYTEIGQYFGGRNHSTIISAERKVNQWLQAGDPIRIAAQSLSIGEVVEALEQKLRAS